MKVMMLEAPMQKQDMMILMNLEMMLRNIICIPKI